MSFQIPADIANSPHAIFDFDDVMVDYVGGLRLHAIEHFGLQPDIAGPEDWGMQSWFGIDDPEKIIEIVKHFNDGDVGNFHRISARGGARDLVKATQASGRSIKIVTSSTVRPESIARRRDNGDHLFGTDAFEEMVFLEIGQSKADVLSRMQPSLFIDDNPGHVRAAIEAGHFGMLLKTSSNKTLANGSMTHCGLPFLNSLYEAIRIVEALPVIHPVDDALRCTA